MKQFYVTSFFFLFIFIVFNSCDIEKKKVANIPKAQIEEFEEFVESIKKNSENDSKIQLVNSFLKKIEKTKYDSLHYKTLIIKTSLHSKSKQIDSAIHFSNKLYNISKKNLDSLFIAKALTKLGIYYKANNELDKAFKNYNESFKISELLKDNIQAGKRLYEMAKIQKNIGDFVGSKETAINGVEFLENTEELKSLSGLYHTISVALKEEGKYSDALEYNLKALKILEHKNKKSILILKNTKANIFRSQNNFKEAIRIYNKLLNDSIVINNKKEYARVLDNKGYSLWLEDNNNIESKNLMLNALEIRNKNNDSHGLIASNIHLTEHYLNDDRVVALEYAETAYKKAKSINAMDDILEAFHYIFTLNKNLKKSIAPELAVEYDSINLTLNNLKSITQDIYATNRYDNDKLIRTNEKQKRFKQLYLLLIVLILCVAAFLISFLKTNYKKQKLEEVYKTETRISKRVHDEVANDVYQAMTKLQSNSNLTEEVLDDMESIYNRTRDISNENSAIDLDDSFNNIISDLLLNYKNETVNIITRDLSKIDWQDISDIKKTIIYRVLQELMVNMKKHSDATIVVIKFGKKNRKITIDYNDNGKGQAVKKGNGLANVENRIESINGTFTFESENNKGFTAKIKV